MVPEENAVPAMNNPLVQPRKPITLAASGGSPQAGVPMMWTNWCQPGVGPLTVEVRFPRWETSIVAVPSQHADAPPPCSDRTRPSRLAVDVVREHDDSGYFNP